MIKAAFFAATVLLATATISHADVISIIDADDIPNSPQGVVRPKNGMSMAQVEQQFGPAEQISSPVGEPPITVWTYSTFRVYFEHNAVIHSVLPQQ